MAVKSDNLNTSALTKALLLTFFSVIQMGILFFFKYYAHSLHCSDFSIFYTGNFLNIFVYLVLTGGYLTLAARIPGTLSRIYFRTLTVLFAGTVMLVTGGILNTYDFEMGGYTFFDSPFSKVLTGIFFNLYILSLFLLISYMWLLYAGVKNFFIFRLIKNSVLIGVVFFIFALLTVFSEVSTTGLKQGMDNYDVGVVLGAAVWSNNKPSNILKARIEKGAELYEKGIISKIQLTGGNAPGELSEAEVALKYISTLKVNPSDILIEKKTRSTLEQIGFIRSELNEKKKFTKIIVISDLFHLRRTFEMSKFYGVKITPVASNKVLEDLKLTYYRIRETVALINFWLFATK